MLGHDLCGAAKKGGAHAFETVEGSSISALAFPIPTHIPIPDSIKVPTVILGKGLLFSILPFLLVPVSHHLVMFPCFCIMLGSR